MDLKRKLHTPVMTDTCKLCMEQMALDPLIWQSEIGQLAVLTAWPKVDKKKESVIPRRVVFIGKSVSLVVYN